MLNKKDEKDFLRQIFEGAITARTLTQRLSKKLYKKTAEKLFDGVELAFEYGTDERLLAELRDNIYMFSGAKTYTQVKDISSLILDGDKLRPFAEFKKLAKEKYDQYNVRYLQVEYDTAVSSAQNAVKWQEIEKQAKTFPYIKYKAVMDSTTCEICKPLDGVTVRVGDPFLNRFYPPNHFGCKCLCIQIDKYEDVTLTSHYDVKEVTSKVGKKMSPVFLNNCGKDRVIFNKEHAYFDVAPRDKALARRNFDLPI